MTLIFDAPRVTELGRSAAKSKFRFVGGRLFIPVPDMPDGYF